MLEGTESKQTTDSVNVPPGDGPEKSGPAQVFISYASADISIANKVCDALEGEGVKCWIAPRDVRPGEFYAADIVHAIDTTTVLVLVLSQHASDSAHVLREVERAGSKRHPVMTLRTDQAPLAEGLEYFLNSSQWLDASAGGVHRALPKLVDAVKTTLANRPAVSRVHQVTSVATNKSWPPLRTVVTLAIFLAAALAYTMRDQLWQTDSSAVKSGTQLAAKTPEVRSKTIAVLPFVDMSPARNQAYLADGISEEILNLLSESPDLRVIARTSSFSFRDKNIDVSTIADKLHVTHILEGSVRKSGQHVRVAAQLVDAVTASNVWSETYDRDERNYLDLQTDIAEAVAAALQTAFTKRSNVNRTKPVKPEAHELYLQGLYSWNRNGPGDIEHARGYFEKAVQLDPAYANAWNGISGVYRVLLYDGKIDSNTGLAKQREAVQHALALAPDLAQTHLKAASYFWDIGDERAADYHLAQARLLAPADPEVLKAFAGIALDTGKISEAIDLQSRAVAGDPVSAQKRSTLARFLTSVDRLDEARVQTMKALELSPGSRDLNADLCRISILQNRVVDAQDAAANLANGAKKAQCLALIRDATGKTSESDAELTRLISATRSAESDASIEVYVAEVYANRGSADQAFEWLARAKRRAMNGHGSEPGWDTRMQMRLSPFLRSLHSDDRWGELVANPWKA